MYSIRTEQSFDAAHFLAGYNGKCKNLHGHRWRVVAEVCDDKLHEAGQLRGMVTDFGDIKKDLKELADFFDHAFIYEEGTLKPETVAALCAEDFRLIPLSFRPTAEEFAAFFYGKLKEKGYRVAQIEVYETPNNCAVYREAREA